MWHPLQIGAFSGGTVVTDWDLSSNTVAHYLCNDDLATTAVIDQEATNGTASVNTDQLSVAGKINDAFDFDGSTESVNQNQTFQTTCRSPHSYSIWIKPDDGQPLANNTFAGVREGNDDQIGLTVRSTGILQALYESDANLVVARTASAVFADGATSWTHIVVNISTTQIDLYVNAVKQALDPSNDGDMSGVTMGNLDLTNNFYFGARNNAGSADSFFDGQIDDFRIHDRVLTQTEINGIYNNGNGTEAQQSGAD